jgi:hypothetical protein
VLLATMPWTPPRNYYLTPAVIAPIVVIRGREPKVKVQ